MTANSLAQGASRRPEPGRRTQVARRAEAEQRMLDAATILVAEKGLAALTLAAVGIAAGYSRGLPTHHFKTRAGLVAALTESIAHSYICRVQAHAAGHSPLDDLLAAIDYYLTDVAADPIAWRSFFAIANAALTDADAAAALSQLNARATAAFEKRIRNCAQAGQVRADVDARAEATLILATLRGMASFMLCDPLNPDLPHARASLAAAVRRNLQVAG